MENKFVLTAELKEIGDLVQIRRTTKPDILKKTLVLVTSDGQILYPEIRNEGLKIIDREGIVEGDIVQINYLFQGSEKEGKRYNNILISSIKKA